MTVSRGEIVAVPGPPAAGKTALLAVPAGMAEPENGVVLVAGRAIRVGAGHAHPA